MLPNDLTLKHIMSRIALNKKSASHGLGCSRPFLGTKLFGCFGGLRSICRIRVAIKPNQLQIKMGSFETKKIRMEKSNFEEVKY